MCKNHAVPRLPWLISLDALGPASVGSFQAWRDVVGMGSVGVRLVSEAQKGTHAECAQWLTPLRFALLLLGLLAVAFPALLSGSRTLWYSDFSAMGLPSVYHFRESVWAGELPLWNPYSNCGAPFLAQWGPMVLYPFSAVYLLLPLPWSLNLFCLGHLLLGGLGMFYLTREWTRNPFAAAIAGTAFVFNGASLSCLVWANYVVALSWAPWLIRLGRQAWTHGGRPIVWAVLAASGQLLSGAPELTVLTWSALGVLFLHDVGRGHLPGSRAVAAWRFASVVVVAALLCAIQLGPFLELLAQSHRIGVFRPKEWAIPATGWANLFLPVFRYGPPSDEIPQMQIGQGFLISYYLGLGPLLLAAFAGKGVWRSLTVVWGVLGAGCLWLAMGDHAGLHPFLATWLPALYWMQFPVKFTLVLAFLVPCLAGLGAAELLSQRGAASVKWMICAVAGALLLLLAVLAQWGAFSPEGTEAIPWVWTNAFFRAMWLVLFTGGLLFLLSRSVGLVRSVGSVGWLVVILMLDATTHNRTLVPQMEAGSFLPGLWSQQNTNATVRLGMSRVFLPPQVEQVVGSRVIQGVENRVLGRQLALWSHLNLLEQIPKVNGSSALPLREQKEVERQIYRFRNPDAAGLLDFLGVSWVNLASDPTSWTPRPGGLSWLQVGAEPRFDVRSNLLQRVFSPTFDSRSEVWFAQEDAERIGALKGKGRIVQQNFGSQRIRAMVDMSEDGILTIAQSFSPNWRAWVNDQPTPVFRANAAFQAVRVPRGLNRVELRYVDNTFRGGAVLSGLTLGGLIWWLRRHPGSRQLERLPGGRLDADAKSSEPVREAA